MTTMMAKTGNLAASVLTLPNPEQCFEVFARA
jgi:hypothetical protein